MKDNKLDDDNSAVQQLIGYSTKQEYKTDIDQDYVSFLKKSENVNNLLSSDLVNDNRFNYKRENIGSSILGTIIKKSNGFPLNENKDASDNNKPNPLSYPNSDIALPSIFMTPVDLPGIKVIPKLKKEVKIDDFYRSQKNMMRLNKDGTNYREIELESLKSNPTENLEHMGTLKNLSKALTISKGQPIPIEFEEDRPRNRKSHTVNKFYKHNDKDSLLNEKISPNEIANYRKRSIRRHTVEMKKIAALRKRTSVLDPLTFANMLKKSAENTTYGKLVKWLKVIDTVNSFILIVNIILALIDNELYISKSDQYIKEFFRQGNLNSSNFTFDSLQFMETRQLDSDENTLRILNMIISIVSCILIVMHYKIKIKLLQIDKFLSEFDGIFTSGLYKNMFIDILICIVFFPPGVNKVLTGKMLNLSYVYSLNSLVTLLILIKLYIILRLFYYCSRWTTNTASAICRNHNVKSGIHFAIKCEMKKRPAAVLSFLFIVVLTILAFEIRQFEYGVVSDIYENINNKGDNDLKNLANCFWLTIITMTTVGYGDFYPRSHLGRFVGVISCVLGMLLLSLIVVSMSSITEFTSEEKKAFVKLKKLFAEENLENKAANVITNILMLTKLGKEKHKRNYSLNLNKRFIILTQLRKDISIFKNDYKIANSYSLPVDEMLRRLESKLKDDILKLTRNISKIKGVDQELKNLSEEQERIQIDLREIIKMQDDISNYLIKLNNDTYNANLLRKNEEDTNKNEEEHEYDYKVVKFNSISKLKQSTNHLSTKTIEDLADIKSKRSSNKKIRRKSKSLKNKSFNGDSLINKEASSNIGTPPKKIFLDADQKQMSEESKKE